MSSPSRSTVSGVAFWICAMFGTSAALAATAGIVVVEIGTTDQVWAWRPQGVHVVGSIGAIVELQAPGGSSIEDVEGIATSQSTAGVSVWLWNDEHLYRNDPGAGSSTVEILDPSAQPVTDVRGVTIVPTAADDQIWIWSSSAVYRHHGGPSATLEEIGSPGGGAIHDARGIVYSEDATGSLVWIWIADTLLRHDAGASTGTEEITDPSGSSFIGVDGIARAAGIEHAVWLWNSAGVFRADDTSTLATEYFLPAGGSITGTVGLVPGTDLNAASEGSMWVWTDEGIFRESTTPGVTTTIEYFDPAGSSFRDLHGVMSALDRSTPRRGRLWVWTADGLFRESIAAGVTLTEEILDSGGQPVPEIRGVVTTVESLQTGAWLWTDSEVYRVMAGTSAAQRVTLVGTAVPISGVRGIVGSVKLGVSSGTSEDVYAWNGTTIYRWDGAMISSGMLEILAAPGGTLANGWTVVTQVDTGLLQQYRMWTWNDSGLYEMDGTAGNQAIEVPLPGGGSITPPAYDPGHPAIAITRQPVGRTILGPRVTGELSGAGVVNPPTPVPLWVMGRTGSRVSVPEPPPAPVGLTSVVARHAGSITVPGQAALGSIVDPSARRDAILVAGFSLSGRTYYYRDPSTSAECDGIPEADRVAVPGVGVVLEDASTGIALGRKVTDETGFYSFGGLDASDYIVGAAKIGEFRSSVDILDALLAARTSVGLVALDTYQRLAADANGDQAVSIIDAFDIAALSAGLSGSLSIGAGISPTPSDWFFEPTPSTVPGQVLDPVVPFAGTQGAIRYLPLGQTAVKQDLCAGLFGDIDADWSSAPPVPVVRPSTSLLAAECSLPDASGVEQVTLGFPDHGGAAPDASALVALSIDDPTGMRGSRVTIAHDPEVVEATEIVPTEKLQCYALVSNVATQGKIQAAWFRSEFCGECDPALDPGVGGELALLTMDAVGPLGSSTAIEILDVDYNDGDVPVVVEAGSFCVQQLAVEVLGVELSRPGPGSAVVRLEWDEQPQADAYDLYRGLDRTGSDATCVEGGVSLNSFEDDGLIPAPGAVLHYLVAAVNCRGASTLGDGRVPAEACN